MDQQKDAVRDIKHWRLEHRDSLMAAGIATITGCYSGEGDDGALQYVEFLDPFGERAKPFEEETMTGLFEALHDELAPEGYENNDGGGGEFRLDIATGAINHESYFLYTERTDNPEEIY